MAVDVCYLLLFNFCLQEARFVNQISITPGAFSGPGDSGSLIVSQDGNQPVALLFAGGDGLTIGIPIDVVLQRFGVTIDGSVPANGPPSAPTGLSAVAGDAEVSLSWTAPSFDGGSRSRTTRSIAERAQRRDVPRERRDDHELHGRQASNDTTYYYKVSAENGNGEGALSNEASATPSVVVYRRSRCGCSTGSTGRTRARCRVGKWSNGVNGSNETGSRLVSNALSCSKSTSCASWWNVASSARTRRCGDASRRFRGLGTSSGCMCGSSSRGRWRSTAYMLRTNQLAGTDEVYLERVDNSTLRASADGESGACGRGHAAVAGERLDGWRRGSSGARRGRGWGA